MKVQARVEKELFKAVDKKETLKNGYSASDVLENAERIKVLKWVLSDKIDDLDEI